jgi:hypothetical protein
MNHQETTGVPESGLSGEWGMVRVCELNLHEYPRSLIYIVYIFYGSGFSDKMFTKALKVSPKIKKNKIFQMELYHNKTAKLVDHWHSGDQT